MPSFEYIRGLPCVDCMCLTTFLVVIELFLVFMFMLMSTLLLLSTDIRLACITTGVSSSALISKSPTPIECIWTLKQRSQKLSVTQQSPMATL